MPLCYPLLCLFFFPLLHSMTVRNVISPLDLMQYQSTHENQSRLVSLVHHGTKPLEVAIIFAEQKLQQIQMGFRIRFS